MINKIHRQQKAATFFSWERIEETKKDEEMKE